VLLSRRPPNIIHIRPNGHALSRMPLVDLNGIVVEPGDVERCRCAADARQAFPFDVNLALVSEPPAQRVQHRIDDLRTELQFREAMLEALVSVNDDASMPPREPPEPLFLYEASGLGVPFRIRQLIMEWTDQPEDLAAVQYAKLEGGSLPDAFHATKGPVHVLSTGAALGRASGGSDGRPPDLRPTGAGPRLREYQPNAGGVCAFDLLPEWVPFGLRLFVPSGRYLTLYPDMRPGSVAAAKLAQALLPGEREPGRWCVLLAPIPGNKVSACCVPLEAFTPLCDAFEWNCSVDAPISSAMAAKLLADQAAEHFVTALIDSLSNAVDARACPAIEAWRKEIGELIDRRLEEIKKLDEGVSGVAEAQRAAREAVVQSLEQLRREVTAALERLRGLQSDAERGMVAASAMRQIAEPLRGTCTMVATLVRQIAGLWKHIRSRNGGTR